MTDLQINSRFAGFHIDDELRKEAAARRAEEARKSETPSFPHKKIYRHLQAWTLDSVRHKDRIYKATLFDGVLNDGNLATKSESEKCCVSAELSLPSTHQFTDFVIGLHAFHLRGHKPYLVNQISQFLADKIKVGIHTDTQIMNNVVMHWNAGLRKGPEPFEFLDKAIQDVEPQTREVLFGRENWSEIDRAYRWLTGRSIRILGPTGIHPSNTYLAGFLSDDRHTYLRTGWRPDHRALAIGMEWEESK